MKTKSERLAKIKAAKKWSQRRSIALDEQPGTDFDFLFNAAKFNRGFLVGLKNGTKTADDPFVKASQHGMQILGEEVADRIHDGDADWFRRVADALDVWSEHVAEPDTIRAEILLCCVPPSATFTVRQVLDHLKTRKIPTDENSERVIRRLCGELGIRLSLGKRGRPRKSDTK